MKLRKLLCMVLAMLMVTMVTLVVTWIIPDEPPTIAQPEVPDEPEIPDWDDFTHLHTEVLFFEAKLFFEKVCCAFFI